MQCNIKLLDGKRKNLYHDHDHQNFYDDFEDDMSIFLKESDKKCHLLYKWVDDLEFE